MLQRILVLSLIFLAGFLSHGLYTHFLEGPTDLPGPHPHLQEDQVELQHDQVILHVPQAQFASFTPTHSMDPVLDSDAHALEINPTTESDIHIGDIISYNSTYTDGTLIHRVINIQKDEQGTYYTLKGDNNPEPDPGKVRFSQIQRILVAILY